ncbi:MAG: hypothetical protein MI974_05395 [Chitinophagales bacterium]|nr:hypothetical protein [Chitinophagales bacterium]
MKTILNLSLAVFLSCWLPLCLLAQDIQTFDAWRQTGIDRYDAKDYEGAIRAFRLALTMDDAPVQNDIDKLINKSFQGYVELLQIANEQKQLEALALRLSKDNPTEALRMAEYIAKNYEESSSAQEIVNELIGAYPSAFYSNVIRHEEEVESVAFSPDGQYVASASWDYQAYLWNLDGRLITSFKGHQDELTQICFSPDGKWILTGSRDNTARLWDITGELIQTFSGHQGDVSSVSFSPDGKTIATAGWDMKICLWAITGQLLKSWNAHDDFITTVSFAPDGKTLASGSWDKTIKIWTLEGGLSLTINGHTQTVSSVCFSPDGKNILSASWDFTCRLWNLQGESIQLLEAHTGPVSCAKFSPDGRYILSSSHDMTSRLWTLNGNELQVYRYHNAQIRHIDISTDGLSFVSGSRDRDLVLWNFTGTQIQNISNNRFGGINDLELAAARQEMLIGTAKHTAFLLDFNGNIISEFKGHQEEVTSVAFSPDGNLIITGSRDDFIKIWDRAGKCINTFHHQNDVLAVACSNSGDRIFSGGWGDYGILWDMEGNMLDTLLLGTRTYDACFSADDTQLLLGLRGGKVALWALGNESETITFRHGSSDIKGVAFSPDELYVAAVGKDHKGAVWNKEKKKVCTLKGHTEPIYDITFSPDGQFLLTGAGDGTAKLWNIKGLNVQTFSGHIGPVYTSVFMPDGQIITAGADQTIRTWLTVEDFLDSGRLCPLADWKMLEYGLLSDSTGIEAPDPFNEGWHASNDAVIEFVEIKTKGVIDKNFNYRLGFYYSIKAHNTNDIEEQIYLQNRAVENTEAAFALRESVPKSNKSVLGYLYSELALWYLAAGNHDLALETVQKGLELDTQEHIKDLIQGKAALVYLYNGQEAKAIELLNQVRNTELNNNRFWQLHGLVTSERIKKTDKVNVANLIKQNLDYMVSLGRIPPGLADFQQILIYKP